VGVYSVALLTWGCALVGGFGLLIRYEATASQTGSPQAAESTVFRDGNVFSVVIGLHPHCPCSRATVAELLKIYSHVPEKTKITALVFKPKTEADSWIECVSLSTLQKMNATIVVDTDGERATSLGLNTSGQIQIYSPQGKLLYNGGITGARGHAGDNIGEGKALALLRGEIKFAESAPTFGCSIK
jgi:hypothetical protein